MPHPRQFMKLTGDIHPPEVEYDLDADLGEAEEREAALPDSGPAMPGTLAFSGPAPERSFEEEARAQVRRNPLVTLGAAFALGFVLVKLFR